MKRLGLWLVALILALAGCSPDEATPSVTATPSPPRFVNGGDCLPDVDDLHPRAGCVTSTHTDDSSLFVYALVGKDDRPRGWRFRYRSDGREIDEPLEAGNPFSYPRAIAAIDVNADGIEEWVIKNTDLASHGTNWQRLELFTLLGDELVPVVLDGEPLWVNVGGPSRLGEGARCDDGRFVLLRVWAVNRQNTEWNYSERLYEIEGSKARFIRRREGELTLTDYNDPKLDPYYRLECDGYVYP